MKDESLEKDSQILPHSEDSENNSITTQPGAVSHAAFSGGNTSRENAHSEITPATDAEIDGYDKEPAAAVIPPMKQGRNIASELFDYVEIFVFSVCAVIFIFTFLIRVCRVDGPSMQHTLEDGDILLVSDLYYTPKHGDIVVFHQTGAGKFDYNKPIVKRVIATAGQYIKIDYDACKIYVSDDSVFDENDLIDESEYVNLGTLGHYRDYSGILETYVPDGYIFVLGDNRNNSDDSRSWKIGLVDTRRVFGKVIYRLLPINASHDVYSGV